MGSLNSQSLLVCAFLVALGGVMHILACQVVGHNPLPLIPMFMYLFTPLPFFLCARKQDIFTSDNSDGLGVIGNFLFGMFASSGPFLTGVLMHTDQITGGAGAMSLLGGACIAAAVAFVQYQRQADMSGF
eukprot:Rhum_TRINITY_DN14577_c1_g1::Rhum_TRINITY_DN14577_c1_g1_i1::g.98209::m.98209